MGILDGVHMPHLILLLLLIKNVFRVTFNRNCYKGTVHRLKS